jgi:hypothetical protein
LVPCGIYDLLGPLRHCKENGPYGPLSLDFDV